MEAGGPSVTARRVAAHRLGFDRAAADYGDPAADQALAADVAADSVGANAAERSQRSSLRSSTAPQPSQQPHPAHAQLPLPALLSQALVAFTIEFDNEAEHTLPHRTTDHGPSGPADGDPKPWLVSMVMWENCMRHVAAEPITVANLLSRARTGTNLDGMRRWGYLTIDGTARKIHKGRPGPDAVLRATAAGLRAREVWRPLPGLVEQRWRDRYGTDRVAGLRDSLIAVVRQLDPGLPDCLPILGAALFSQGPDPALPPRPDGVAPGALGLPALLSRVLLSLAVEYEREAGLSLAVSANLLRILGEDGIRRRDLPALTGISKEAVAWALGVLVRAGMAAEEAAGPDPGARRGKVARLTPRGLDAQRRYHERLGALEADWRDRFGADVIRAVRGALEPLVSGEPAPLLAAIAPYPDNWRARLSRPAVLPCYPMVLHRGGYPDGS